MMKRSFVQGKLSKTYGKQSNVAIKRIIIHETANLSKGADATAHAKLQANGNTRDASWHYQVDATQVIQSYMHDVACWHSGKYNIGSIGIELCVNGGFSNKAFQNLITLVAELKEQYPNAEIVQHYHATGKDCPKFIRQKGLWEQVVNAKKEVNKNEKIGYATIDGAKTFQVQSYQFTTLAAAEKVARDMLNINGVNGVSIKGYK